MNISDFAIKLQSKLPKSEIWADKKLVQLGIRKQIGISNFPYGNKYIPDFINYKYRYILEIDGNIHTNPAIVRKDREKNEFYKSRGFTIFRVKAFNNRSLCSALTKIGKLRNDTKMVKKLNNFRCKTMYESNQCY